MGGVSNIENSKRSTSLKWLVESSQKVETNYIGWCSGFFIFYRVWVKLLCRCPVLVMTKASVCVFVCLSVSLRHYPNGIFTVRVSFLKDYFSMYLLHKPTANRSKWSWGQRRKPEKQTAIETTLIRLISHRRWSPFAHSRRRCLLRASLITSRTPTDRRQ